MSQLEVDYSFAVVILAQLIRCCVSNGALKWSSNPDHECWEPGSATVSVLLGSSTNDWIGLALIVSCDSVRVTGLVRHHGLAVVGVRREEGLVLD